MKKNKYNVIIVILSITIILSIIMGIFLYVQKIKTEKQIEELEKEISKSEEIKENASNKINSDENKIEEAKENENNIAVLELSPIGGIALLYKGEVYVNVYDTTPNIDNVYGDGKYQILFNTRKTYREYEFDSLTINNNITKWLKLNESNVTAIHNNEYGQGISSENPKYGIIMLKEDKTLSYISILDLIEGKIETTKLNLNDINDIETEDDMGLTTYAVDRNGHKKDINDYIK